MPENINERLKSLREGRKMSQEEFGKVLGISKSGVSDIENGRRNVTEQHIIMLRNDKSLNVSERWLRTGEGEMLVQFTRDEEIARFVGSTLACESDTFQKRFISMLSRLSASEWEMLERMTEEMKKG